MQTDVAQESVSGMASTVTPSVQQAINAMLDALAEHRSATGQVLHKQACLDNYRATAQVWETYTWTKEAVKAGKNETERKALHAQALAENDDYGKAVKAVRFVEQEIAELRANADYWLLRWRTWKSIGDWLTAAGKVEA